MNPILLIDETVPLPHRNCVNKKILSDDVKVFFVFKSLVNFDDLGVIKSSEYYKFLEDIPWIFNVFLFYSFDGPDGVGVILHLSTVDDTKRTSAYHLIFRNCTSSRS